MHPKLAKAKSFFLEIHDIKKYSLGVVLFYQFGPKSWFEPKFWFELWYFCIEMSNFGLNEDFLNFA